METLATSRCPECKSSVSVPNTTMVAEIVLCSTCSTELEVVATYPIMLAVAPEVEEDWGE